MPRCPSCHSLLIDRPIPITLRDLVALCAALAFLAGWGVSLVRELGLEMYLGLVLAPTFALPLTALGIRRWGTLQPTCARCGPLPEAAQPPFLPALGLVVAVVFTFITLIKLQL